jgi:hypothetical protein
MINLRDWKGSVYAFTIAFDGWLNLLAGIMRALFIDPSIKEGCNKE